MVLKRFSRFSNFLNALWSDIQVIDHDLTVWPGIELYPRHKFTNLYIYIYIVPLTLILTLILILYIYFPTCFSEREARPLGLIFLGPEGNKWGYNLLLLLTRQTMASDWQKNVLCRSAGLTIWLWNFLTMCTVNGKQCCGSKYRYMEFGSGSWGRYVINFEKNGKNTKNSFGEKTIFFKKAFFKLTTIEENNGLGRNFLLVKSEWWFFTQSLTFCL